MHKFLVIAHRFMNHVRKSVHEVIILAHSPEFDLVNEVNESELYGFKVHGPIPLSEASKA
jgi:hypothetical protein